MNTRARRALSIGVATLLAVALLYYSLRGIEWGVVAQTASNARPVPLALAAGLAAATLFLRAIRWRVLLNAEGTVTASVAFWASAAGYFGNNFLPARAGELIRTAMISSQTSLSRAYVLATAVADRAADAIVLVAIGSVVAIALPRQHGWMTDALRSFGILALIAAAGIATLPFLDARIRSAIDRLPLSLPIGKRVGAAVEHALRGVRAFHDTRRLSAFLLLTIAIWSLDVLGTVVTARAMGLQVPVSAAVLLIAGLGLGSALPSTPGYMGIYQFVAVMVFVPFGLNRTDAIAFILVAQAVSYVVISFWGAWGLWIYRRSRHSA